MSSDKYYDAVAEALVAGAKDYIDHAIADIERRIKALEERPVLSYRGVWAGGGQEVYAIGDIVTHGGSAWVCRAITLGTPGQTKDWQLMVKKGNDGKDAKS